MKIKELPQKKGFFAITTLVLSLLLFATFFMGMKVDTSPNMAALSLGVSGNPEDVTISIEKPSGWKTKETPIKITIESSVAIAKVEVKTGSNGSYADITDDMAVTISENCTVYIQVTDKSGKVYTKSRYLEIFDRVIPTVKATISNNLLRIEADDELSGVSSVYVDDEIYTDLSNDTLDIRVKSLGRKYEEITIQAVDVAGNKSKVVTVKNPNYTDDSGDTSLNQQASTTSEVVSGTATTTDTKEQDGTATGTSTTAPTSGGGTSTTGTPTTTSDTGSTSDSANNAGSGGTGDSSDAPLFGTFEDTQKQFMSIVTGDGAVYYLIIDHDKPSENVYLLSEVTNAELASFTPQTEATDSTEEYPEFIGEQPKDEEVGFIDDTPQENADDSPDDTPINEEKEEVLSDTDKGGSPGTSIFIVLTILGIGGAGFYFKVYKPKKELESYDDLDDFEFEEENNDEGGDFFSDEADEDGQEENDEIVF